jgi:hypothetical protein
MEVPVRSSSFPINRIELYPGNDQAYFVRVKMWHGTGRDTIEWELILLME